MLMFQDVWRWRHTTLLTVTVGPLHVVFHVALLGEADAAHLTLERLLSRVLHHVDLQGALLVEGLVTLTALEGTLACRQTHSQHPSAHLCLIRPRRIYFRLGTLSLISTEL